MRRSLLPLALILLSAPARAEPPPALPVPRLGSCPSGYGVSGGYCAPRPGAGYAVARPRGASCPSGYGVSGDYCLARDGARLAVPRSGSCPSGYGTSGDYCLAYR